MSCMIFILLKKDVQDIIISIISKRADTCGLYILFIRVIKLFNANEFCPCCVIPSMGVKLPHNYAIKCFPLSLSF